ncbi:MAG: serine/threonine-protein kinase [Gemmataceae bacterium]
MNPAPQAGVTFTQPPVPGRPERPAIPGYEIVRELGRGGMGMVYEARDTNLKRTVAVKTIRTTDASPQLLARFRAEAEAVASLRHPNIVQIYAWGEHAGQPYIVLEYMPGSSLNRHIDGKPWPPREAARLVLLLARAMQAAHAQGIIHRDLKPANVLLDAPAEAVADTAPTVKIEADSPRFHVAKISDFGLVKSLDSSGQLTASGAVMGSPKYMAPEQAAGEAERIGRGTDIYALGGILYELLTGRPPFDHDELFALLYQIRDRAPTPPRAIQAAVPADLEAVCLRCLQKTPEQRYPTMAALADDLQRFLGDKPVRTAPPRAKLRLIWVSAAAVAVVAVAVGLLQPWKGRPRGDGPSAVGGDLAAVPPANPVQAAPLKGGIDVLVWDEKNPNRRRLRLSEPGAVPLRPGDGVRVEAWLNRQAYMYVVWLDTEGKAIPVYPWEPGEWDKRPPAEKEARRRTLSLPLDSPNGTWPMRPGDDGMISLLLLARDEPLPADSKLRPLFASLKRQDSQIFQAVWFQNGEEVRDDPDRAAVRDRSRPDFGNLKESADPVLQTQALLRTRLAELFPYTHAVCFGFAGK